METQLDIFDDKAVLLSREVLKNKLLSTQLNSGHPEFEIFEWVAGDDNLPISYQVRQTPIGEVLLAATEKGIVYLGFNRSSRLAALADLKKRFPANSIVRQDTAIIETAASKLDHPESDIRLPLHLKGTTYQLGIWEKLLTIPFGGLVNYKRLGNGEPDAREIGAAVGANPVSVLVPCHRVIRADGTFNGYYWGNKKKAELLIYEASANEKPAAK